MYLKRAAPCATLTGRDCILQVLLSSCRGIQTVSAALPQRHLALRRDRPCAGSGARASPACGVQGATPRPRPVEWTALCRCALPASVPSGSRATRGGPSAVGAQTTPATLSRRRPDSPSCLPSSVTLRLPSSFPLPPSALPPLHCSNGVADRPPPGARHQGDHERGSDAAPPCAVTPHL